MATFKQYSKKDGSKAWLFQAYLGVDAATGKEIRTTRRGFKTKKEAQIEANRLVVEFEEKGLLKQSDNTFKEIYLLWYESYKTTVKETTSLGTERLMTRHALPVFGDLKINKIDVKLAQKTVNTWAKQMKTYKFILQYCSKVMDYAVNLDLIQYNPFNRVIRPNVKEDETEEKIKFYNLEEVHQVMAYLENKVDQTKNSSTVQKFFAEYDLALYRLLAFSGLRGGEATALTFDDIDFANKTVTVNKTLSEVRGGYTVSTPKTKSSYRTISLDDKTIMILKKWQLRQRELLFANRGKKSNYVFVNTEGKLMNRTDLYQRSKRLAMAVGLHNIGTHGWRHSHASMLFEAGVTMKEAQERLGHSSITQTMDTYTHLGNKAQERTVDKLTQIASF